MRITIIRHGQTEWNRDGLIQGHTDIALDDVGIEQAERLGERFRGAEPATVYSSDLKRAAQTAVALARRLGVEVQLEPLLRERNLGEWEGLAWPEFARQVAGLEDRLRSRPPGGESLLDVWERLQRFVAQLPMEDCYIVTHGGTGCALLARLLCDQLEASRSFRLGNTAVSVVASRHDGSFFLESYNCLSHLNDQPLGGDIEGISR